MFYQSLDVSILMASTVTTTNLFTTQFQVRLMLIYRCHDRTWLFVVQCNVVCATMRTIFRDFAVISNDISSQAIKRLRSNKQSNWHIEISRQSHTLLYIEQPAYLWMAHSAGSTNYTHTHTHNHWALIHYRSNICWGNEIRCFNLN